MDSLSVYDAIVEISTILCYDSTVLTSFGDLVAFAGPVKLLIDCNKTIKGFGDIKLQFRYITGYREIFIHCAEDLRKCKNKIIVISRKNPDSKQIVSEMLKFADMLKDAIVKLQSKIVTILAWKPTFDKGIENLETIYRNFDYSVSTTYALKHAFTVMTKRKHAVIKMHRYKICELLERFINEAKASVDFSTLEERSFNYLNLLSYAVEEFGTSAFVFDIFECFGEINIIKLHVENLGFKSDIISQIYEILFLPQAHIITEWLETSFVGIFMPAAQNELIGIVPVYCWADFPEVINRHISNDVDDTDEE